MPQDFAGNVLSSARNISLNANIKTFIDWVGQSDLNDYYKFTLSARSSFSLTMDGMSSDADVQLLNGSGQVIASSLYGNTNAELISRTLETGTYYVNVYPYASANTYYNLYVSAIPLALTPQDFAGNSLQTARSFVVGTTSTTFKDWVGKTDTNDYYAFSVNNRSNVSLNLNGMSANADVQLLNSNGQVIASSARGGTNAESISITLDTDVYYIRVCPYSGAETFYNLSVSATAAPPITKDSAGNTLQTARYITVGSALTSINEWVSGTADNNDVYRFTLTQSSDFFVGLDGLNANVDVQILNSQGLTVSSSNGDNPDRINTFLETGTYYLWVYPGSDQISSYYTMNLSSNPRFVPSDFAGNSLSNARNIDVGFTGRAYSDWVGPQDTQDYYRFNVSSAVNFNMSLQNISANLGLQLIRDLNNNGIVDNGEIISSGIYTGVRIEFDGVNLSPGNYYVRVYSNGLGRSYYEFNEFASLFSLSS